MTGCGTIDLTDVGYIEFMNKKIQVLKVHKYKISQGGGTDKRWFTGLMATNPARIVRFDQGLFAPARVKPDAGTQIFFPDELELVLKTANIRASETNDEMYLAIPIYIYTGVRPGECLALKFSDFDSAINTVNITRSFAVKETLSENGIWSGRHYEV